MLTCDRSFSIFNVHDPVPSCLLSKKVSWLLRTNTKSKSQRSQGPDIEGAVGDCKESWYTYRIWRRPPTRLQIVVIIDCNCKRNDAMCPHSAPFFSIWLRCDCQLLPFNVGMPIVAVHAGVVYLAALRLPFNTAPAFEPTLPSRRSVI